MPHVSFRLPLRTKIVLLLIITALIPFLITNIFWYFNTQNSVRNNAQQNLITITQQSTDNINNFLNTKLLGFLSHSQGAALLTNNQTLIQVDLVHFLLQDPDLQSLAFVNDVGQEIVKVDKKKVYDKSALKNISTTPEFKVATFQFGKEYVSPVNFTKDGAEVIISTPVVYPKNSQSLLTFSSVGQIPRAPGEVFGVLTGVVSLKRLQDSISSIKIGTSGYLYLIDQQGRIIVHQNNTLIGRTIDPNTNSMLHSVLNDYNNNGSLTPIPLSTDIIDNTPIIGARQLIKRTKWTIIGKETLSQVSADIIKIQQQAFLLFILPLVAVFVLSLLFSHNLISPIRKLVKAAAAIGSGDFDYTFSIKTGDELEHLANSYYDMAQHLKNDRNAILAEKNTLTTVLDSTADGVIGINKDYIILFANKSALQMIRQEESNIREKPLDAAIQFQEKDLILPFEKLCQDESNSIRKLTMKVDLMESETINLVIAKVPDIIVSPIRYILTMYDISKEQKLEELKVDFVSIATHELRTPLTSIKGYLSVFIQENRPKFSSDQNMFLDRINTSVQRLGNLVENLLSVARIEKGALTLNLSQEIDWPAFVSQIVEELKNQTSYTKVNLIFQQPPLPLPKITVDTMRIYEVLVNLIGNALAYTPANGTITVWVENIGNEMITHVSDTGKGIPQDAIPHLFTKFFRVVKKYEQGSKGTGLGLYISKSIIDMHYGRIWVESEEGKGSTFSFTIPLKQPIK